MTTYTFQEKVRPWMKKCFKHEVIMDSVERGDRYLEESLELYQALGLPKERALALVDYVYNRPVGELKQEVGGVMVTLAALCLAKEIDMHDCGEVELTRIWRCIPAIRKKQASKQIESPLPGVTPE